MQGARSERNCIHVLGMYRTATMVKLDNVIRSVRQHRSDGEAN